MLIIGLTGGIGCGKTTVTNLFAESNVPIIDADEISHKLVQKGQPALNIIKNKLGSEFLHSNGELNRDKLRSHIHSNSADKKLLEDILHPLVYKEMHKQLKHSSSPYAIFSIPLLFETNFQDKVDRILVVDCPERIQIERVQARNKISIEEIKKIMSNQCSRSERIERANDIIDNSGSLKTLINKVQRLHLKYLEISASNKTSNPSK
ncbi:MAG: dephospho-CoA kinase [Piscirickettsiaceae bacterium]|nr:MAG: dephospho-CoA kinase [Piscirickettsiaceae bacterium]